MNEWIARLYDNPDMLEMGHLQRSQDLNLGLGWIYYGLGRVLRPRNAVVIGSWRGFVPIVIAKALQDNGEGGRVVFIDPSLVDDFWADEAQVRRHFEKYGVTNIEHVRLTTGQFTQTETYRRLEDVGLLFVDGFHDAAHARLDFEAFRGKLTVNAYTVFHDSVREYVTYIYGEENAYAHDVFKYMDELRADPQLDVLDFPFASGMTIVRSRGNTDHAAFSPHIRRPDGTTAPAA